MLTTMHRFVHSARTGLGSSALALALLAAAPTVAALAATPAAAATPEYGTAAKALLASPKFAAARRSLDDGYDTLLSRIVALTEIESPPFGEEKRGKAFLEMLRAEGLADVETDAVGNVMGLMKGTGGGKELIVITAHLDTVFPAGTNVTVRREGDRMYAPGIGDDTAGLPVVLAFAHAMKAAGYKPRADILFMGNVGEEGPGDLRGVRHLFTKGKYKDRISAFISIEPGRAGRITDGGVGSRRYKVTFTGPGGHSLGDFGLVNPAYAMANAMVAFARTAVPATPRTSYNVGIVEGGTSVNSIPFATAMTVDMRSVGKAELDSLEKTFLATLQPAVDKENADRSTAKGTIRYEAKLIGDRPVGATPRTAPLVRYAAAMNEAMGFTPAYGPSSTDSNMPMSLGIPAVTLGSGFQTFRGHSLEEGLIVDKAKDVESMAVSLGTLLLLSGAR